MEMPIEAAVRHGVNVFIYDWYWYDNRPFLENCLMIQGMKYAIIFVACLPLLIAYPFVQKYFTKGMMIGAVKG